MSGTVAEEGQVVKHELGQDGLSLTPASPESVESVDTLCLGEKDKRMRAVCPFHNPLMLCMLRAFGSLGVRGFRGFRGQGGCPFITH